MPVKTPTTKRGKKIDAKIVRAWFDTAVNPLLSGLDAEETVLKASNWTWRFQPPSLLSLAPVREYVRAVANLEQFYSFYPECERLSIKHDAEVQKLFESCQVLHAKVKRSGRLNEIYQRAVSDLLLPQGKSSEDLFGAHPVEERMDVLAEHIVNSTGRLPGYYAPAPLWNANREKFLSLHAHAEIQQYWASVEASGETLLATTKKLIDRLKSIRNYLSLEYGEPLVAGAVQI